MSDERQLVSTGSPYERRYGYSRAVRVGSQVFIGMTAAIDADGAPLAPGDGPAQVRHILGIIARALSEAGAMLEDVVRTRIVLADMAQYDAVLRAHGEVFGDIRPVTALSHVPSLIDPAPVVEIEADAVIASR